MPIFLFREDWVAKQAFRSACARQAFKYTPHAAKHTIAAEKDRLRLTQEQRKAWSENMGHENEQITASHFGKLTEERRLDLFQRLKSEMSARPEIDLTDAQKIALVNSILESMF